MRRRWVGLGLRPVPLSPVPGRQRIAVRPEATLGDPGLSFELFERAVRRVSVEPPSVPGADQLLVEAPSVNQDDLGQGPTASITSKRADRDNSADSQVGSELPGVVAERLAAFGTVDTLEPDLLGAAVVVNGEAVAVLNPEHPAPGLLGKGALRRRGGNQHD